MPANSSSPTAAPGRQPLARTNTAGLYCQACPAWWWADRLPAQAKTAADRLMAVVGPGTYPAKNPGPKANPTGALLYGAPGKGKTAVALEIARRWGQAGLWARFQDALELSLRIRGTWRRDAAETANEIVAEFFKPDLLVLDDVGKRAAPEDQEMVSVLVNGRQLRGKPTILTTNADLRTDEGRAAFNAGCDQRIMERFTGLDFCADKWGANLRRAA